MGESLVGGGEMQPNMKMLKNDWTLFHLVSVQVSEGASSCSALSIARSRLPSTFVKGDVLFSSGGGE